MFKKIFRAAKNLVVGTVKGLPLINVIGEIKDINRKDVADRMRRIAKSPVSDSQSGLKEQIYRFADIMDDGKENESFNAVIIDKAFQLLGSLIASGLIIYELIKGGL